MPTPVPASLHEAFSPHCESAAFWSRIGSEGEQMSAQYLCLEAESLSAHCGSAVTPSGTSVGHGLKRPHLGEQKSPPTPWI